MLRYCVCLALLCALAVGCQDDKQRGATKTPAPAPSGPPHVPTKAEKSKQPVPPKLDAPSK